jgi:hypothetical protein
VAAASVGPAGQKPTLAGAGSTFDEPFFAVAFAQYQQQHTGVTIGYSAVGSSAGIAGSPALNTPEFRETYLSRAPSANSPAFRRRIYAPGLVMTLVIAKIVSVAPGH